ncbi:MAG: MlaE family lipid ABC transporter permease subunit [Pseudomonadota bacterium]
MARDTDPTIQQHGHTLTLEGHWRAESLPSLTRALDAFRNDDALIIDASGIASLDTAGAWYLTRSIQVLEQHQTVSLVGLSANHAGLMELVASHGVHQSDIPHEEHPGFLEHIGRDTYSTANGYLAFLAFIGRLTMSSLRIALTPAQLRWSSVVKHIEEGGFDALPIVGLLTFLLGIVIAYQGGIALSTYGASIYTADFVGLAMVRELSPLITAIIVAGRTGSAYTAQIATMKVTEEIDALRTMGISPVEELALPKFFALLVALPLLTVFGDIMGLLGGMVMANSLLDVSFAIFVDRVTQTVSPTDVIVGVGKAPVFALMIAAVGCYQGFEVQAGAEQVGHQTTISVVQAIFLVLVTDALFSVVFSKLGI